MVLHPCQAALLGDHFISSGFALSKAQLGMRLGVAVLHGHCPSFPGVVGLAKVMLHVQTCPAEACGGMLMSVRLVKV